MLKLNTKLKIPLIASCLAVGGLFLYQYLTFIPEYSNATSISTDTPVTITPTTPLAKWEDLEYMQQMSPTACNSVAIGTSKTLKDSRDPDASYTIKRLSDEKCWMIDNLRITNKAISSADSDLPEGSTYNIPASSNPWSTNNSTSPKLDKVHYADNTTHGAYYTWYTTTAGTGIGSATSGEAPGSICPKGWRLPTSGSSGEFQALYDKGSEKAGSFSDDGNTDSGWWLGGTANATGAAFFTASGNVVSSSSLKLVGSGGYYWSSTPRYDGTYILDFRSGYVYPSTGSKRYFGYSVRCIAKTTSTVTPATPPNPNLTDPTLSVTIPRVLTLNVTDSVNIETNPNNISTGTFTASVISNANYSISLNATSEDASATSLVNIKDNKKIAEIPTITSTTQPTIGISSWGIRKCNNLTTETCIENYKPLPTKNSTTGNPFLTSTPGNHQHLFQIGIGIGPELPSGTYTTSITVTASQN